MAILTAYLPAGRATAGEQAGGETVILDTKSFWRFRTVRETPEIIRPDGKIEHVRFIIPRNWFRQNKGKVECPDCKVEKVPVVRLPESTSPDWMKPGFDDSTWARLRGPMLDKVKADESCTHWKLILMRGLFRVEDPAKVKEPKLSLTFRGGAVVYLNGEELVRKFMPEGQLTPNSPSLPYPEEVYLDNDGYLVWPHDDGEVYKDRHQKRIRRLTGFEMPASKLRKGVNVLAISIHRAPAPDRLYIRRIKRYPHMDERAHWTKTSLIDVKLTAPAGSAVAPNTSAPKGRGFLVWNHSIVRKVYVTDYPDPFAALSPIRLTGVKNGTFAGQVVVGQDKPIKGLKATATDLEGPGAIPAKAVTVRYALPDGAPAKRGGTGAFDSLEEFPPAEVPVYKESGSAIQPIWVTVDVPAEAKPGDYSGKVTVSAEGVAPVEVPLRLQVIDWTLPDPNDFTPCMDIVESPDSLAMAYGAKPWSEEHMALLHKMFALLKPMGNKTIYITAIRRTHWGNEHAMVRWYKDEKGELQPDFEVVEKYLDVAVKYLGKVPGVIFCCWEPVSSMGHAGGAGGAKRTHDKPIQLTLWDRKTGRLKKRKGPAWGTPECKAFWARFNRAVMPVLKKRGLEKSMLYGLVGDARPTKLAMDYITTGVEKPLWAVHSHYYCVNWQGYDMGMAIALWGIGAVPVDPAQGYGYGWKNPFWLSYYPREMSMSTSLVETRTKLENWMGAKSRSASVYSKAIGTRGLGRLGADFWKVLKNSRGQLTASLAGRYPESYWGQLNLNYGVPHLFGKGKNGPVPTLRSEAFRENIQEVEARIFIERALLEGEKKAKLGEKLAGRCRALLDKRIRTCLHAQGEGLPWFVSSGWGKRTEELFRLASEVTEKLRAE